jgi:hypothetical protein
MNEHNRATFQEQHRVIAVDGDHVLIRGVQSGQILTIVNPQPETPLNEETFRLESSSYWLIRPPNHRIRN